MSNAFCAISIALILFAFPTVARQSQGTNSTASRASISGRITAISGEGATNVLRHSRATRCTISIASKDGHLRLTVLDDGRGSETLDPGQGLRGLRERIEPLGGQLSTEDLAGGGFQLTVDVPIQQ